MHFLSGVDTRPTDLENSLRRQMRFIKSYEYAEEERNI